MSFDPDNIAARDRERLQLMRELRSYIMQGDELSFEEALDDHNESEWRRRLDMLVGTKEMAEVWGVSQRRAQAHIAAVHQLKGYGHQLGGDWFLERQLLETCKPRPTGGRPARIEPRPASERSMNAAARGMVTAAARDYARRDFQSGIAMRPAESFADWQANGDSIARFAEHAAQRFAIVYEDEYLHLEQAKDR